MICLVYLSSYGLGCAEWQCGDPMSYSGYDYSTIAFEGACWFAENLRTLAYSNGEDIPSNLTDSQWNYADYGAATVYGEDDGCNNYSSDIDSCDPLVALEEYGRLYNWYAVNDDRGLCPVGWHVPSEGVVQLGFGVWGVFCCRRIAQVELWVEL